jgi:hypothetical protein
MQRVKDLVLALTTVALFGTVAMFSGSPDMIWVSTRGTLRRKREKLVLRK